MVAVGTVNLHTMVALPSVVGVPAAADADSASSPLSQCAPAGTATQPTLPPAADIASLVSGGGVARSSVTMAAHSVVAAGAGVNAPSTPPAVVSAAGAGAGVAAPHSPQAGSQGAAAVASSRGSPRIVALARQIVDSAPRTWAQLHAAWRAVTNPGQGDCFFHALLDADVSATLRFDIQVLRDVLARVTQTFFAQAMLIEDTGEYNQAASEIMALMREPDLMDYMQVHFQGRSLPHVRADWEVTGEGGRPTAAAMAHFAQAYVSYLRTGGLIGVQDAAVCAALLGRVVVITRDSPTSPGSLLHLSLGLPQRNDTPARPGAIDEFDSARGVVIRVPSSAVPLRVHYHRGHFEGLVPCGHVPQRRAGGKKARFFRCAVDSCCLLFPTATECKAHATDHGRAGRVTAAPPPCPVKGVMPWVPGAVVPVQGGAYDVASAFVSGSGAARPPTAAQAPAPASGRGRSQRRTSTPPARSAGPLPASGRGTAGRRGYQGSQMTVGAGSLRAPGGVSDREFEATPMGGSRTPSPCPRTRRQGASPPPGGFRLPDLLDAGTLPWEELATMGDHNADAFAEVAELRHLLSSMPFDRLHLPHMAAGSIVELYAWWSPSRSRASLVVERQLTRATTLVMETLSSATRAYAAAIDHLPATATQQLADAARTVYAPHGLSAEAAFALWHLFPTLMLQHSEDRSVSEAMIRRLLRWQRGEWEELFSEAGLLYMVDSPERVDTSVAVSFEGTRYHTASVATYVPSRREPVWTLGCPGPASFRPGEVSPALAPSGGRASESESAPTGVPVVGGVAPLPPTSRDGQFTGQQQRRAVRLVRDYELSRAMQTLKPVPRLDAGEPRVGAILRDLHPPLDFGEASVPDDRVTPRVRVHPLPSPLARLSRVLGAAEEGTASDTAPSDDSAERAVRPSVVSLPALRAALRKAPRGSSCGPDGWRFEHLKTALSRSPELQVEAPRMLSALHGVVAVAAAALLPASCRDAFATASLSALRKPSAPGELKVRPVAAGNVLRRLTGMVLAAVHVAALREAAGPNQVAVGRASAAEGTILAVRQALLDGPAQHVAAFDAKNAFNEMSRQLVLDQVATLVPALLPYIAFVYGGGPIPITSRTAQAPGYVVFWSAEGVQQGDPLGPALFALGLAPALAELAQRLRQCAGTRRFLLAAYLDDITVVSSAPLLRAALHHVPLVLRRVCSLEIQRAKTQIWPPLPPPYVEASSLYDQRQDDARWQDFLDVRGGALSAADTVTAGSVPDQEDAVLRGSLALGCAAVSVAPSVEPADMPVDYWPVVEWEDRSVVLGHPLAGGAPGRAGLWGLTDPERVPIPWDCGLTLLGAPIGAPAWEADQVWARMSAVADGDLPVVEAFSVSSTEAVQCAMLLLIQCVFSRVVYILRTMRPERTLQAAERFDDAFRAALSVVALVPRDQLLSADSVLSRRAALPVRLGGMQWRRAADLVTCAFVAGAVAGAPVAALLFPSPAALSAVSCPGPFLAAAPGVAPVPVAVSPSFASLTYSCELGIETAYQALVQSLEADDGRELASLPERARDRVQQLDQALVQALTHGPESEECLVSPGARGPSVAGDAPAGAAPGRVGQLRLQHSLTALLETMAHGRLRASLSAYAAEHLDQCALRGAYDWVFAVPHTAELTLVSAHYWKAVARRLMLPVLSIADGTLAGAAVSGVGQPCSLCKKGVIDVYCMHRLTQQCGGHRNRIHDRVAAVFYQAANAASWPTYMATAADELHLPGPSGAVPGYLCDYVMVGLLSVSPPSLVTINVDAVVTAVESPGIAARRCSSVVAKREKHAAASRRAGHHFVPLEFSNLGGVGSDALQLLQRMADALASQSCAVGEVWRQDQFVACWVRRISIVMQQAVGDEIARVMRSVSGSRWGTGSRLLHAHPSPATVAGRGATWRDVDTGAGVYRRACRAMECGRVARF